MTINTPTELPFTFETVKERARTAYVLVTPTSYASKNWAAVNMSTYQRFGVSYILNEARATALQHYMNKQKAINKLVTFAITVSSSKRKAS